MTDQNRERWRILCEQAANEQDPKKLIALIEEINRVLSAKDGDREPPLPKAG
ncbi:MAG: hypothetical protein WAL71_14495 [Terriglobales bacterium]|jgi:hypothetical protein